MDGLLPQADGGHELWDRHSMTVRGQGWSRAFESDSYKHRDRARRENVFALFDFQNL